MEGGKTTEGNGIGDSKQASVEVPATAEPVRRMWRRTADKAESIEQCPVEETQISLPSTVAYNRSSVDEMLLHAIGKIEKGDSVRAVDGQMIDMAVDKQEVLPEVESILSDHDKIIRLENTIEEERDISDRMLDIIDELEVIMRDLLTWKKKVDKDGCDRYQSQERKGKYIPYIPGTEERPTKTPTGARAPRTVGEPVRTGKVATSVPANTGSVPTYKKETGTF